MGIERYVMYCTFQLPHVAESVLSKLNKFCLQQQLKQLVSFVLRVVLKTVSCEVWKRTLQSILKLYWESKEFCWACNAPAKGQKHYKEKPDHWDDQGTILPPEVTEDVI